MKPLIGIIKLDTNFRRIWGDIGNPKTWKFPVIYQTMKNIPPGKVVFQPDYELQIRSIESAQILEKRGVNAVTTTCGFLGRFQREISNSVKVPVFTSSLLQVPLVYNLLAKDRTIGILTANCQSLKEDHLLGCNIKNIPLAIKGMDNYEYFQKVFIQDQQADFDKDRIKKEILEAVIDLVNSNGKLGAVILECTNMSPYAYDIQRFINLPVFDMCSLMRWAYAGLSSQQFI